MVSRKDMLEGLAAYIRQRCVEKGIEVAIEVEEEGSLVTTWYKSPTSENDDSNIKQGVRGWVKRVGKGNWKEHLSSMKESGFSTRLELLGARAPRDPQPTEPRVEETEIKEVEEVALEAEKVAKLDPKDLVEFHNRISDTLIQIAELLRRAS